MKTLAMELGQHNIRANAILPGAVDGDRIQRVFEGRARASGQSIDAVRTIAIANQSIKRLTDPRDIAALAVFLARTPPRPSRARACRSTPTCSATRLGRAR